DLHGEDADPRSGLARARARVDTAPARLEAAIAEQKAKLAGYQQRKRAGRGALGRRPRPVRQARTVVAAEKALANAEKALIRAEANPRAGGPPKANTTDPGSRVMPVNHGGFRQARNIQV